jgi:spermidine/putrescine transport system permease protein
MAAASVAPRSSPRWTSRLAADIPLWAWTLTLVVAPGVLLVLYSLWTAQDGVVQTIWNLDNYDAVVGSPTYRLLLWRTLYTAAGAAAVASLIAYPMAYFVYRRLRRHQLVAVILVIIPLWVSLLMRVFAWKIILGERGVLNTLLVNAGILERPSSAFLYTRFSVFLVFVYVSIPFVFIASYTALARIPNSVVQAAYDAGARPWHVFRTVIWPLSKQGAAIGFVLAFLLAVGDYLSPSLVGGLDGTMVGSLVQSQFGLSGNWPLGAAMAAVLLVCVAVVAVFVALVARSRGVFEADASAPARLEPWEGRTRRYRLLHGAASVLFALPYLFLYAPLVVIGIFSFNDSEVQALPFAGFTTRWYEQLLSDAGLVAAFWRTIEVGTVAVSLSLVVGTGFALVFAERGGRFSIGFQSAMTLPALLPGVVLGLALAITFRVLQLPFGFATAVVGHASFITPVVTLIVLARLKRLDPELAQASMDLGGGRVRTLIHVIYPQLRSVLVGAALLGFTLSFDEVLVTFFVAGDQPTLPVYIFNQLRFGFTPTINAIFACVGTASLLALLVASRILRRGLGSDAAKLGLGA